MAMSPSRLKWELVQQRLELAFDVVNWNPTKQPMSVWIKLLQWSCTYILWALPFSEEQLFYVRDLSYGYRESTALEVRTTCSTTISCIRWICKHTGSCFRTMCTLTAIDSEQCVEMAWSFDPTRTETAVVQQRCGHLFDWDWVCFMFFLWMGKQCCSIDAFTCFMIIESPTLRLKETQAIA